MPVENTDQSVNNSSLKHKNEETKLLMVRAKFNKAEYEEKLNK